MRILLASSNDHKKSEFSRLLPEFDIVTPKDLNIAFNPNESGSSFIENAIIKAKDLYDKVHLPVLSDDSGLCIDSLGGKPGVHTARFGDDEFPDGKLTQRDRNLLILEKMKGIEKRNAHFVCALCLYFSPYRIYLTQEETVGIITECEKGENGFGYDPIFFIEEMGKCYAELTGEEKDALSHRGKAIRSMRKLIKEDIDA